MTRSGHPVKLDPRTFEVGGSWTEHGVYDPRLLSFFIAQAQLLPSPVILDAGAGTGSFTLAAKFIPGACVYAFEPNPTAYSILCANVRLNQLDDRVQAFQVALADSGGLAILRWPSNTGLGSLGRPMRFVPRREELVHTARIDELGMERIDLLKLDIEGGELNALRGATDTIRRCRPAILYECNHLNTQQFGYHPDEIEKLLRGLGYRRFARVGKEDVWATSNA